MKKINNGTKTQLLESYKKCRTLLHEKRLNESTFAELISGAKADLAAIHDAVESGLLANVAPLDDDEELNIQQVLDTSEADLNADGTKNESYYKKHSRLLQERNRSHKQRIADYIAQGGTKDFSQYQDWLATQPDFEEGRNLPRSWFLNNYDDIAESEKSTPGAAPVINDPTYVPSKELTDFIDFVDAGDDFVETAIETVADKYDTIDLILRRVVRGKNPKRYYILAGDAGIGKTYTVQKILEEEGKSGTVETVTGTIGKSPTTIATFLWKYRDAELVVLDDCDAFLKKGGNDEVLGILKGAMEAGTKYHVHITDSLAKRVSKAVSTKDESTNQSVLKKLFEGEDLEDEDLELDDDDDVLDDDAVLDTEDDDHVPTDWTFNARLVIISNLHEAQVDDALWSRCDHFDLHLTQEEYMVRLGMIIDGMDCGQKDGLFAEDAVADAKALLYRTMKLIIEAGNHGVKMYGRTVTLKQSLEFRLVKDLVAMYLAMVERQQELHPELDLDTIKKGVVKKWTRIGVVPRLSATTK